MTDIRMFESIDTDLDDHCEMCRWQFTEMCPGHDTFAGRPLQDLDNARLGFNICHRFCLTNKETERRHEQLMKKLSENIIIDN